MDERKDIWRSKMIKLIAAVDKQGAIGKANSIPWSYPEDMKWFRSQTKNSTVIFGRRTYESMGSKLLPKRHNIIITKTKIEDVDCFPSLEAAIADNYYNSPPEYWEGDLFTTQTPSVWLIGGENIYREGMRWAEEIYLTLIPEYIDKADRFFPWIDPTKFKIDSYIPLFDESGKQTLQVAKYIRA